MMVIMVLMIVMMNLIQFWSVYAGWWKEDNGVGSFSWAAGLEKQGRVEWGGVEWSVDDDGKETGKRGNMLYQIDITVSPPKEMHRLSPVETVSWGSQACYIH